jgi:hypothetical protein
MWENFLAIYIYIYIYIYINQSAYKNTLMKNKEDNNKWFSRTNLHESHYMVLTTDWWWRDWYLHDDMKKQEMVLYTDKLNSETFFEVNAPSKSNVSRNYKHIHSHFVETLRPPINCMIRIYSLLLIKININVFFLLLLLSIVCI